RFARTGNGIPSVNPSAPETSSHSQSSPRSGAHPLARKYHPDLNKSDAASEKFKEINAAYDVVGDAEKRKLFDEFGEVSMKPGFDANRARQWKSSTGGFGGFNAGGFGGFGRSSRRGGQRVRMDFGDFGFGNQGSGGADPTMEDLLNMFGGGRTTTGPRKGADIENIIRVDLKDALDGATTTIQIRSPRGGNETLRVRIPKGIHDGGTIRLRGKGRPGVEGGPPGDMLLKVELKEHPLLRREGDDLTLDVPLTIHEAMTGGRIEVPTLGGAVRVNIPAGISGGQRLRLRGKGMPRRQGGRGDLYLVLRPTPPPTAEEAAITLAEQMDAFYPADVRAGLKL
ncbi:MAG: DnaJ C-terminal domain-containing protein, partial [Myxococcota bacterium]